MTWEHNGSIVGISVKIEDSKPREFDVEEDTRSVRCKRFLPEMLRRNGMLIYVTLSGVEQLIPTLLPPAIFRCCSENYIKFNKVYRKY